MKDVLDVTIEDVVIIGSAFLIQCFQCNTATIMISNILFVGSFGPLKMTHYYWVGLLLLVQGVLLLIFTLTYTTIPSASLVSLVIAVALLFVLLAYTGGVYRCQMLSLLECSFLLNL